MACSVNSLSPIDDPGECTMIRCSPIIIQGEISEVCHVNNTMYFTIGRQRVMIGNQSGIPDGFVNGITVEINFNDNTVRKI